MFTTRITRTGRQQRSASLTGALLAMFFMVSVFTASVAQAKDKEYKALVKEIETLQKTASELHKLEKEMEGLQLLGDPWTINRIRTKELTAGIGRLQQQYAAQKPAYNRALAAYKKHMAPIEQLTREALETHKFIRGITGGNDEVKRRALATVERDLMKLQGPQFRRLSQINNEVLKLLKRAKPDSNIEDALESLTDDPALKLYLNRVWNEVGGKIMDLPELERVKKWNDGLGKVGKVLKAYRILAGGTDDTFGNEDMERIANSLDLVADLMPKGMEAVSCHLLIMKLFVEDIHNSLKAINFQVARRNLKALQYAASNRAVGGGDNWLGMHPKALFGMVMADTRIAVSKTTFFPGEPITGTWKGQSTLPAKAWLGVIPASVVSTREDANDAADLDYIRLESVSGTFSFDEELDEGDYVIRLFDGDESDALLIDEATFHVGVTGNIFRTRKAQYTTAEGVIVEFAGLPGRDGDWVTVIKASESDDEYEEWYWVPLTNGVLNFSALSPGSYEARLYYNWPDAGYTVAKRHAFTVQ